MTTLPIILVLNIAGAVVHTPSLPDSITSYVERADYMIANYSKSPYWQNHSLYIDAENLQAIAYLATVASPEVATAALIELLKTSFDNIDNYCSIAYYYD